MSGPQRIKLIGNHLPVNVQVVAFLDARFAVVPGHARFAVACPGAGAGLHALPQQLAHGLQTLRLDVVAQVDDGAFQRARIALTFVSLAVALEAAALVEVKHRAAELAGCQRFVQPLSAQRVRVFQLQRLALVRVGGKEAVFDQLVDDARLAPQQAVAPPSHRARSAAGDRQRGTIFGVSAIAEDAHAGPYERHRCTAVI